MKSFIHDNLVIDINHGNKNLTGKTIVVQTRELNAAGKEIRSPWDEKYSQENKPKIVLALTDMRQPNMLKKSLSHLKKVL